MSELERSKRLLDRTDDFLSTGMPAADDNGDDDDDLGGLFSLTAVQPSVDLSREAGAKAKKKGGTKPGQYARFPSRAAGVSDPARRRNRSNRAGGAAGRTGKGNAVGRAGMSGRFGRLALPEQRRGRGAALSDDPRKARRGRRDVSSESRHNDSTRGRVRGARGARGTGGVGGGGASDVSARNRRGGRQGAAAGGSLRRDRSLSNRPPMQRGSRSETVLPNNRAAGKRRSSRQNTNGKSGMGGKGGLPQVGLRARRNGNVRRGGYDCTDEDILDDARDPNARGNARGRTGDLNPFTGRAGADRPSRFGGSPVRRRGAGLRGGASERSGRLGAGRGRGRGAPGVGGGTKYARAARGRDTSLLRAATVRHQKVAGTYNTPSKVGDARRCKSTDLVPKSTKKRRPRVGMVGLGRNRIPQIGASVMGSGGRRDPSLGRSAARRGRNNVSLAGRNGRNGRNNLSSEPRPASLY